MPCSPYDERCYRCCVEVLNDFVDGDDCHSIRLVCSAVSARARGFCFILTSSFSRLTLYVITGATPVIIPIKTMNISMKVSYHKKIA